MLKYVKYTRFRLVPNGRDIASIMRVVTRTLISNTVRNGMHLRVHLSTYRNLVMIVCKSCQVSFIAPKNFGVVGSGTSVFLDLGCPNLETT